MNPTIKRLWKNEYFQTAVVIVLIVTVVFGFWFGAQAVFNTEIPPALAVISGSMDMVSPYDQGWEHPFAPTLQIGDLIIIQGVNPADLNANYPNSDIIVFHRPDNPSELVVHRIVNETTIDGKLYFFTKGDGNPPVKYPAYQPNMYDGWSSNNSSIPQGAVSQDLVVGKVVMRIPLVGYIPMIIQDNLGGGAVANVVIPIVVIIIVMLVIVEFILPLLRKKAIKIRLNRP